MSDSSEILQNFWHAVATSKSLESDILSVKLLEKDYVLWRTPDGSIGASLDICSHRQAPLSKGHLEEGCLKMPLSRLVIWR